MGVYVTISDLTRNLLTASYLKGIGPSRLHKLAGLGGFENITLNEIGMEASRLVKKHDHSELHNADRLCQEQMQAAANQQFRIISLHDNDYPEQLRNSPDAPFFLYVKGNLPHPGQKSVAIVGSREPTPHGLIICSRITEFFAAENWSVVSGLAIGCDTRAHQTALEKGAHTVAVLAHGLQTIKPAVNRELAEEIVLKGGALVSEFPYGQNAFSHQYVIRDKTQAGMSKGVVMIQSKLDGGSLHAARAAIRSGRWLAVPYPTEQDRAEAHSVIEANLVLASEHDEHKLDLMRCEKADLDNIVILQSKENYPYLLTR